MATQLYQMQLVHELISFSLLKHSN
uniref:Uncharacterized protein n=1 Tax=Rhizophora mucronata TaxID=61149 RepID=A0A2P2PEG3_RHIMU